MSRIPVCLLNQAAWKWQFKTHPSFGSAGVATGTLAASPQPIDASTGDACEPSLRRMRLRTKIPVVGTIARMRRAYTFILPYDVLGTERPSQMQVETVLRSVAAALVLGTVVGCSSGGSDTAETSKAQTKPDNSAPAKPSRPAPPDELRIVLETTMGRIVVELDEEHAPLTVANFLQYVESEHYDGTIFHQVVDGYVVLAGAYTPELEERTAGVAIRNEADNGLKNTRGTIAMARELDRIDSSTCQFFINLSDNPELDHHGRSAEEYGYSVFGRVVQGLDVVDKIAQVESHSTDQHELIPIKPVVIKTARHAAASTNTQTARQSDSRVR